MAAKLAFEDADNWHSASNVEKMQHGAALTIRIVSLGSRR